MTDPESVSQPAAAAEKVSTATTTERLQVAYRNLQQRLQTSGTSAETVELLRRLAAYRHRLEALDAAPSTRETAPTPAPPAMLSRPAAAQAPAERPARPSNLVIRFLVEGPDSTDIGDVAAKIRSHFNATWTTARASTADLNIDWLQFEAGSFQSAPICFELMAASGTGTLETRRYLRSTVDAIIVVVDAVPDNVRSSTSFVSQALEDIEAQSAMERPEVTIFAHRSDRTGAMDADQVAAELLVESAVRVVATSEEGGGFYYGFAVATNAAVRRAQHRSTQGRPRNEPSSLEQLVAPMGDLFDPKDFRPGQERPIVDAPRSTGRALSGQPDIDQAASPSGGNRTRRTRALKRLISALRTEPDD